MTYPAKRLLATVNISANRKMTAADELLPVFHEVTWSCITHICVNLLLSLQDTWLSKWLRALRAAMHSPVWAPKCLCKATLSAKDLCSYMISHQCALLNVFAKYLMLQRTSYCGSSNRCPIVTCVPHLCELLHVPLKSQDWHKNRNIGSSWTVSHQHELLNVSAGSLTGQMAFNILGSSMVFCQYKLSSASTSYLSLRRTLNTGGSCGVSLQLLTSNVVAGYVHVQRLSNLWAIKEFLYCMHFQMTIKSSLKDQRLQMPPPIHWVLLMALHSKHFFSSSVSSFTYTGLYSIFILKS
jgi:hypothetical protein